MFWVVIYLHASHSSIFVDRETKFWFHSVAPHLLSWWRSLSLSSLWDVMLYHINPHLFSHTTWFLTPLLIYRTFPLLLFWLKDKGLDNDPMIFPFGNISPRRATKYIFCPSSHPFAWIVWRKDGKRRRRRIKNRWRVSVKDSQEIAFTQMLVSLSPHERKGFEE